MYPNPRATDSKKLRGEEIMSSFAERLIEQGRIKGEREAKRKGFIKGMQDILIILIRHKFGVSPKEEEMIRSVTDESKLDAAAEAVLDAKSKDEVLKLLGQ